ncbi:LysE family translocator [Oceanicola sp. S124]|uniref:LysE family translocator n=1 Tax=Oceanicola sp. S124 TaxID=1042378 RepID=UPI0002558A13|nr:LysE family translocator [Oceanicola sp. S124]
MDLHLWLTFVTASVALLLIPGPTVVLVLSYAISQGRRVALATAAGVALGDLIAMSASLAGLGALVLASAKLFLLLKWLGAAYLVYLGVKMIRTAPDSRLAQTSALPPATMRRVFLHATAVTALNPKSIIFFIAFVPQFLSPETALLPQFGVLIPTFVGLAALNALAYALLADRLRQRLVQPRLLPRLTRLGGGALCVMGVATAALRRA